METIFSKDSDNGANYIAFFDLDRTITKAISGKALVRSAIKKGLLTRSGLINAIFLFLLYKLGLRDPMKIINDMVGWVKGLPEKTLVDLCSEVFREVLLPSVYEEARSEIKIHKEKNAKVVILSSSLTPVCMEIAKNLGMDDIICSELEVINGYLTGCPVGLPCYGEVKVTRLIEYCTKNNINPSSSWYYGDSILDLPALSAVGNPVCVNPDKKLKKAAHKRGWKILLWN
jgi:HAD superfamily hydrolase (TIGR01490 family)